MINTKKIMSLCLAGGLVLSSMPKVYAHAENPLNIETNISNVKKDLSYEEYCVLCYNACEYLKSFGLDVSIEELYAPVYIQNIAYINENTRTKLLENGFISSDVDTNLNNEFSILALISTYNDNLFIQSLSENREVNNKEVISISNLLINENDIAVAKMFDSSLTSYINSGKQNDDLFNELFSNYKMNSTKDYGLSNTSIGARTGINLTSGAVFYAHISPMHPVNGNAIASDEKLMDLSESIHDINEICEVLENNTKVK